MLQKAKTLFFPFDELINIIFRPIPSPQLEFLLFYKKSLRIMFHLRFI